jgi:hypothetical protein
MAGTLLKDGGIKAKIVRQYIPVINKLINKYLAVMDFFVSFELNESFEETIKARTWMSIRMPHSPKVRR